MDPSLKKINTTTKNDNNELDWCSQLISPQIIRLASAGGEYRFDNAVNRQQYIFYGKLAL